jgi:hypothetical protein
VTTETQTNAETVQVAALLPPADRDRLVELAAANERSIGGEVRIAIREHLARAAEGGGR